MEDHPFPELKIDSTDFLNTLSGRSKCTKCDKSRKYYCYTCYVPVSEIQDKVPQVKLPIKVDIIKHPHEVDGKSTAVHAKVISHDDVTIYTYPCIPDYDRGDKVLLVFPGPDSVTLKQLADVWLAKETDEETKSDVSKTVKRSAASDSCSDPPQAKKQMLDGKVKEKQTEAVSDDIIKLKSNCEKQSDTGSEPDTDLNINDCKEKAPDTSNSNSAKVVKGFVPSDLDTAARLIPGCPVERIVFIDSTWNQTRTICNDERLKGLRHVELKLQKTKFWRHQKDIPDTYLSTIEAIYYMLRDFHDNFVQTSYRGEYDNLLFFFTFMYKKICGLYEGGAQLKAYIQRKEGKQVTSTEK